MKHIITKKRNKDFFVNEKAIIGTILKTLELSSSDSVLEIADKLSISANGFFDNIGCYTTCLLQNTRSFKHFAKDNQNLRINYINGLLDNFNGGQFDYIFIYNIENNLEKLIKNATAYTVDGSKIIVLNTLKIIDKGFLDNLKNRLNLNASVLVTDNFSLMIITV